MNPLETHSVGFTSRTLDVLMLTFSTSNDGHRRRTGVRLGEKTENTLTRVRDILEFHLWASIPDRVPTRHQSKLCPSSDCSETRNKKIIRLSCFEPLCLSNLVSWSVPHGWKRVNRFIHSFFFFFLFTYNGYHH